MKITSLGRMAVFNIPGAKWENPDYVFRRKTIATLVDEFLMGNYNGYTVRGPFRGMWRKDKASPKYIEMVMEVKASFRGKERIPKLQRFLAGIAKIMKEECIYLECGEDSFLIYPDV